MEELLLARRQSVPDRLADVAGDVRDPNEVGLIGAGHGLRRANIEGLSQGEGSRGRGRCRPPLCSIDYLSILKYALNSELEHRRTKAPTAPRVFSRGGLTPRGTHQ
jgi:hypothetical protein